MACKWKNKEENLRKDSERENIEKLMICILEEKSRERVVKTITLNIDFLIKILQMLD